MCKQETIVMVLHTGDIKIAVPEGEAALLDGLHPNPAQMVPRIQQLMEAVTKTSS